MAHILALYGAIITSHSERQRCVWCIWRICECFLRQNGVEPWCVIYTLRFRMWLFTLLFFSPHRNACGGRNAHGWPFSHATLYRCGHFFIGKFATFSIIFVNHGTRKQILIDCPTVSELNCLLNEGKILSLGSMATFVIQNLIVSIYSAFWDFCYNLL